MSVTIPSKGVLLMGTVVGASNLPRVDEKETDGRCFFRVLYVEGGGSSTMFKCKTPIYSSEVTDDLQFPQWSENLGTFRFEMIMPAKADNSKSAGDLRLQGQILVAIYRLRAQGGSEFLGQASFNLTELSQNGTKECHQQGVEARSLNGAYPLIDRFDNAIGNYAEVQLKLELAWTKESIQDDEVSPRAGIDTARSEIKMKQGSVSGTVRTHQSGGLQTRPSSAAPLAFRGQSKSNTSVPVPVKVVSAQLRKQTEERRRIEAQNKLMQNKLQALGTRGRKEVTNTIYSNQDQVAEPKQQTSSSASISGGRGRSSKNSKDTEPSLEDVSEVWRRLKRDISEREEENLSLRAILTKLKNHSKKYELTTDKLKKQGKPSTISATANESIHDSAASRSPSRSDSISKDQRGPVEGLGNAMDEDIDSIADHELREVLMENITLQQIRRDLIDRARKAKIACEGHIYTISDAQFAETVLRKRIALVIPFAVDTNYTETTAEQQSLKELLQKLYNVQLDCLCSEAARDNDFHIGPLLDSIQEDRELVYSLRNTLKRLQQETERHCIDRDEAKEKLNQLTDENIVYKLKDSITELRLRAFKMRRSKRLDSLETGSHYIEKNIAHIEKSIV
jgi:hypothetical protein